MCRPNGETFLDLGGKGGKVCLGVGHTLQHIQRMQLVSATETNECSNKGAEEEEEEGRRTQLSWVLNNCLHTWRYRRKGEEGLLWGGEAILGKGLTGPEARGGKSQLSTMTRKTLVLAGAEAVGSGWRGR